MIDVVVAGAGPAGLCTAIHAARSGLSTVVLEPRTGPVDKACGEGLMPGARRALAEIGVVVKGHRIRGIRYVDGENRAQAEFRSGCGAGVRRTELQAALVARAGQLGVEFCDARVETVTQDERSVAVAGLRARYLVAADGLHSGIRRQVGLDAPADLTRPGTKRWGVRQHFATSPWTDFVEVHWAAQSELYITPLADDLIGIAVLSSRRESFAQALQAFPAVADRMPLPAASAVRGAGPLRRASRRRVAGRVLLVGDAAGYVDALTGDGIGVAQSCAAALVQALVADRPERYERGWLVAGRRYRLLTEGLLRARQRPAVVPLIVPVARRVPWLFSAAVNQLAR